MLSGHSLYFSCCQRARDVPVECKCSMHRNHLSWSNLMNQLALNFGRVVFSFSMCSLPLEKLQTFSKQKSVTQAAASAPFPLLLADKHWSSGGTCFCGANCNYSKLIKCRRICLTLSKDPWLCGGKIMLQFYLFQRPVIRSFVLLLFAEFLWEENLWQMLPWNYRTF